MWVRLTVLLPGTQIAIASRCDEPASARALLKLLTIEDGRTTLADCVAHTEIKNANKTEHFASISKASGVAVEDMVRRLLDRHCHHHVSRVVCVPIGCSCVCLSGSCRARHWPTVELG